MAIVIYFSDFKPVKLRLKIDLVSYPARVEGLVDMDIQDTAGEAGMRA